MNQNTQKAIINYTKLTENIKKNNDNLNVELQHKEPLIKKKIKYNQLLRMIKRGAFVSARLTAKALGIDFRTVLKWIKTKKAQEIAAESIERYIEAIERTGKKDWKAYDRLLQYAIGEDNNQSSATNNILIVNNDKEVTIKAE